MPEYFDTKIREWVNDPNIHFSIKSYDDFDLTACDLYRNDGQMDSTTDRINVTCKKCKETEYFLNPNIKVI